MMKKLLGGFMAALVILMAVMASTSHVNASTDCESLLSAYEWDNNHLSMAGDTMNAALQQLQSDYFNGVTGAQLDADVRAYNAAYGDYQGWVGVVDSDLEAMKTERCM